MDASKTRTSLPSRANLPNRGGADLFWKAMMRYAAEGPDSLDAILSGLDAAWPDDG